MKKTKFLHSFKLAHQILFIFLLVPILMAATLLIYFSNLSIDNKNKERQITAKGVAASVIEKIDRNFYERFGDVQAFAYNMLSVETAKRGYASKEQQEFINTMMIYYVLYDMMMIVNSDGLVVASNTVDKNNTPANTKYILGKDYSNQEFFRACMAINGVKGGAWYSDMQANSDVAKFYDANGFGMAFTAPIKDEMGKPIGVWYNFASWSEITQQIRKQAEIALNTEVEGAFIVITEANGMVIDAEDAKLILSTVINAASISRGLKFQYLSNFINFDDYIISIADSKGAYIYKGKQWKAITFIPKQTFHLATFLTESWVGILIIFLLLIVALLVSFLFSNHLATRINIIKDGVQKLSMGELVTIEKMYSDDEITQTAKSVNRLVNRMKITSEFAHKIADGSADESFKPTSEKDTLGFSLINMKTSLNKAKIADQHRAWAAEGLATLSEILRSNNTNLDALCDKILKATTEYVVANQGALYILNDTNLQDRFLELKACYAWNKKRYLDKRFEIGEGIIGDAFLEGDVIHLTEIPQDFLEITSGLGMAQPNCIIILPLKTDKEVVGVLELASFGSYHDYVIDFLTKLVEIMALTIESTKVNERTKILLTASLQQTEELQAQGEEMRQNMEELNATQEELDRKSKELSKMHSSEMNSILVGINQMMATIEFTPDGHILNANDNFLSVMKYSIEEIRNKHHQIFLDEATKKSIEYKSFWKNLAEGKSNAGIIQRVDAKGNIVWLNAIYTPILDGYGNTTKVIKYATDITSMKLGGNRL